MSIISLAKRMYYLSNRLIGRRNVYIDCGANCGEVLSSAIMNMIGFDFHAFEPLPEHQESLQRVVANNSRIPIQIHEKAVWVEDGSKDFFLSKENSKGELALDGSTLIEGKKAIHKNAGVVDYENPITVQTIDFASWVKSNFKQTDYIVVKMDIEGAEYAVLQHLIDQQVIKYFNKILVEFHVKLHGETRLEFISLEQHEQLVKDLNSKVNLVPWH